LIDIQKEEEQTASEFLIFNIMESISKSLIDSALRVLRDHVSEVGDHLLIDWHSDL